MEFMIAKISRGIAITIKASAQVFITLFFMRGERKLYNNIPRYTPRPFSITSVMSGPPHAENS